MTYYANDVPMWHNGDIQLAKFREFHEANPHIFDELLRLARKARLDIGLKKSSIRLMAQVLRWDMMVKTRSSDFKISNNHTPYYARMIMDYDPRLEGLFELRTSYADDIITRTEL